MQELCLYELIDSQRAERIKKDQDPELPQIQDYQKLYILINRMVLAFNDLPLNIIYTALTRNVEDADGNEFLLPMIGSNKPTDYRVSMQIASHMTSYGHFKVEVVDKPVPPKEGETEQKTKKVKQRAIYWEDTGAYRGKDRTTRLTPKTVLPPRNALDFVAKMARGEIDRTGKPVTYAAKKAVQKKVEPVRQTPAPDKPVADAVTDTNEDGKEDSDSSIELASTEA
jgi:hypothetical protein